MRRLFASAIVLAGCGGSREATVGVGAPVEVVVADAGTTAPLAIDPRTDSPAPAPGARVEPIDPIRDPRRFIAHPRSTALVEVETTQLDRLLAATPSGAPDRPALLRRVAEDYCELARGRETTGSGDPFAARNRAIEAYSTWIKEAPATSAGGDEVRYFLGLEWERTGNVQEARRAFFDLIRLHPASKYVPAAYFAFGEMFFAEARADADRFDLARQAYREVLKYPPPANWLAERARQRIGELAAMPLRAP